MNDTSRTSSSSETPKQLPQAVYFAQPPATIEDDEINLLDYWRVLVDYKWLIFLMTFVASAAAVTASLMMTPIYKAEVLIAPADEKSGGGLGALAGQFGGLASLAGISLGGGGGQVETAIATINSRAFTDAFIKERKLMPVLFDEIWDEEGQSWLVESVEQKPTAWKAYKTFNKVRSVSQDKKTGMVVLAIEWKDPELAAQWANELVVRINVHQKAQAIAEARDSIAYLKQELEQTSVVEMQQSIYRLIEAQTKQIMLANVREDYAFKVIDPAVVPEEQIKPKRALISILGFMVGLMLGVFSAFLLSFIKKQKQTAVS
jgi:uncharacterized protein involved in exopolysaccharide biosynthesis